MDRRVIISLCVLWIALAARAQEYQLVWNEDFTESSLDRAVWNIEVNGDGGGNNELQYYCERGVSVGIEPTSGKHCLILTARKEDYMDKKCTSGRVNTKNNTYYTYGKIEARVKFPKTANGLWPAFWQMGNDFDQVNWPRCGETDIIELGNKEAFSKGTQERYFNGALHLGSSKESLWSETQSATWPYSVEDTFHIITMIWTPTSIDMYMDKESHPTLPAYYHADLRTDSRPDYNRQAVFGKPQFMIANLAIGGQFPGIYTITGVTALSDGPQSMYIDWIRIYQRGDENESFTCPSPSDEIEPEGTQDLETVSGERLVVSGYKFLRDGQIFISRNGAIYRLDGRLFVHAEE